MAMQAVIWTWKEKISWRQVLIGIQTQKKNGASISQEKSN